MAAKNEGKTTTMLFEIILDILFLCGLERRRSIHNIGVWEVVELDGSIAYRTRLTAGYEEGIAKSC